jgi:hypothetical protein
MNELITTEPQEQWVHYSGDPSQIVFYTADQSDKTFPEGGLFKPHGLWITPFGQQDNWFEWCQSEDFRKGELNYIHDVTLAKGAKILRISSVEGLDAFSKQYARKIMPELSLWMYCDWAAVAEQYHGMIISPYQWSRRLMHSGEDTRNDWYYCWDCASGCIWNENAIADIKLRSKTSAGYVSKPPPDLKKLLAQATNALNGIDGARD